MVRKNNEKSLVMVVVWNGWTLEQDFFDPQIGRWYTQAPLADKFLGWSSYNYAYNNHMLFADPGGMSGEPVIEGGKMTIYSKIYFYSGSGNNKTGSIAANNIQKKWTAANGTVTYQGQEYKNVNHVVTYEVVSEARAQFLPKIILEKTLTRK
jgi:hypothetical protein